MKIMAMLPILKPMYAQYPKILEKLGRPASSSSMPSVSCASTLSSEELTSTVRESLRACGKYGSCTRTVRSTV